jgi:putative DNA primase/helicase
MLDAALAYTRKGLRVFPCEKKVPLIPTGFKAASSDEKKIREWWGEWPGAQIALPTGRVNGLFVLDVDGPAGAALAATWNLPETFAVETQPGHQQLWFRQPDGVETKCSAGVLGEQLDTRGDGGYVIAPPSIHHETGLPYRIVKNLPRADPPSFLLEPKKNGAQPSNGIDAIPKGKRHQTMLSIAGAMRARNLSGAMVLAQLELVNLRQCKPPLEDSELQKLADYVGTKLPGFRGQPMETSAAVDIECFQEVTPEELRWLWHKRVPAGKLTLFVGDPGQGKSLVTIGVAAHISRGDFFPDGARSEVGDVIFLSAEDDPRDTQLPRLIAANANLSRIHRVKAVKVTLADGATGESQFNLERDIEKLDEALARIPNARLLIIDPVSAYMGKIDTHRDAEIRRVLTPLGELAARRRIAVIGVMHLKKSETSALLRVSGSVGFVAAARVVWGFGENPDVPGSRVMVAVKNNLAAMGDGLSYSIESVGTVPRIAWQQGSVHVSADEVLASDPREKQRRGERQNEAEQWLCSLLGDGGEKNVTEIMASADKAGIAWRTLKRAKQDCGIRHVKRGREWFWVLA